MKKIITKLNIAITFFIAVYIIGNIETILLYFYESQIDTPNSIWLKYKYILRGMFGRSKGIGIFYKINSISWWFVENHKNTIFFIIITIMMIVSLIINKKTKKLNKVITGYFVICFFVMIFIAFLASPKFAEYYF